MTNQVQAVINDPWESAQNPNVRQPEYWGQCHIDMYYAALIKGVGKVPFDATQHTLDKRVTAIDIHVTPIAEMNSSTEIFRNMIKESREWGSITFPSIKSTNVSARELNEKFVHIRFKETGETYVNKNGETKNKTGIEFVKAFSNQEECVTDFMASKGIIPSPTQYQTAPVNNNGKEKETAYKFLAVIVENAARGQKDLNVVRETVATNLSSMPLVSKYFTVDSPETMTLIMEKMAK